MQALLNKAASKTSAQTTTLGQEKTTAPKQEQITTANQAQRQQLDGSEQLDADEILLKNINDADKYINSIFGPLCSICNSNNSNLVMGSIFNNPYSIQLDTKFLLDKNDIDYMFKNASKDDKKQLKIILKNCFGINDATKYPVAVEYFDLVQFPILMSNDEKLSGSCLNDCLSVLSNKVSKVQEKRSKYSKNIGYGTFGVGTVSSVVAVTSFFLVPIPFLQIVSLLIMGSTTLYMTATRGKNMYDGVKNKVRSMSIENIVKKKERVIKFFHEKIKEHLRNNTPEQNKITTPEQKLSNNAKDQTKERGAIDKNKLKDISSKVGDLLKQPVKKGNDENNNKNNKNEKNDASDKSNKDNDINDIFKKNVLSNDDNKSKVTKNGNDNDDNEDKKVELPERLGLDDKKDIGKFTNDDDFLKFPNLDNNKKKENIAEGNELKANNGHGKEGITNNITPILPNTINDESGNKNVNKLNTHNNTFSNKNTINNEISKKNSNFNQSLNKDLNKKNTASNNQGVVNNIASPVKTQKLSNKKEENRENRFIFESKGKSKRNYSVNKNLESQRRRSFSLGEEK